MAADHDADRPAFPQDIPRERLETILEVLRELPSRCGKYIDAYGERPVAGSLAADEALRIGDEEAIQTAIAQARLAQDAAFDHMSALARVLENPVHVNTAWTCTRVVLECSARAWSLLDRNLAAAERVSRSLAFRERDIGEQAKFIRAHDDASFDIDPQSRLRVVQEKAKQLGLSIPNAMKYTDAVRSFQGSLWEYRALSAAMHGESWGMRGLVFEQVDRDTPTLEKRFTRLHLEWIATQVLEWVARTMWERTMYLGLAQQPLVNHLEWAYNKLEMRTEVRFWRTDRRRS